MSNDDNAEVLLVQLRDEMAEVFKGMLNQIEDRRVAALESVDRRVEVLELKELHRREPPTE